MICISIMKLKGEKQKQEDMYLLCKLVIKSLEMSVEAVKQISSSYILLKLFYQVHGYLLQLTVSHHQKKCNASMI